MAGKRDWNDYLLTQVNRTRELIRQTTTLRDEYEHNAEDVELSDFEIVLKNEVQSIHKPAIKAPATRVIKDQGYVYDDVTASEYMRKAFDSLWPTLELMLVTAMYAHLNTGFKGRQISLQAMDPKAPVRWVVVPCKS
jgi:hypothetical protein